MEKKETKKSVVIKPIPAPDYTHGNICKSNPYTDADKTISGLAVDVNDMLQTGVVKDSGETLDNNGIEDPNAIVGRVRDSFDALDAARIIKKYGKKSPAKAQSEINNITNQSSSNPNE